MKSAQKGFTLVELMIVITVIAILATMSLYGVTKAQASARDTSRQQVMSSIRSGLEKYYADNGKYYDTTTVGALNFNGMIQALVTGKYLTAVPTDPNSSCVTAIGATGTWSPCAAGPTQVNYAYVVVDANCPGSGAGTQGYELVLIKEGGGTSYFCSPK